MKHILYLFSCAAMLCIFAACSKDKDEPVTPDRDPIPYFKWPNEKPNNYNVEFHISADTQTLSIVAFTNMKEVRIEHNDEAVWIEYKDMIRKPEVEQVEFLFNIYSNPSDEERTGYIVFGSPTGTDSQWAITPRLATVIQAGK